MKKSTVNALQTAAEELGIELTVCHAYSGRCMYGKTTCGVIVGSFSDLLAVAVHAGNTAKDTDEDGGVDDLVHDLRIVRQDNMGYDIIFY